MIRIQNLKDLDDVMMELKNSIWPIRVITRDIDSNDSKYSHSKNIEE